jgi:hypothetical protein
LFFQEDFLEKHFGGFSNSNITFSGFMSKQNNTFSGFMSKQNKQKAVSFLLLAVLGCLHPVPRRSVVAHTCATSAGQVPRCSATGRIDTIASRPLAPPFKPALCYLHPFWIPSIYAVPRQNAPASTMMTHSLKLITYGKLKMNYIRPL